MVSDRGVVGCNAERAGDLYCAVALRQLPQPAEQAFGGTACEHDAIVTATAICDPQRGAREDRQLALLLARGDDRQLVLPARTRGRALLRERADKAAR